MLRYPHDDHVRSVNHAPRDEKVSEVAERDHVSAERKGGIDTDISVKESVRKTGTEDGKANDQGREKDVISQKEEREPSFETHSDTGVCTH